MLSADYTHKLSEDLFTPSNLVGQKQSFATDTVTTDLEDQIRTRLTTGGVALTMNVHPANDFTVTSISNYRRLNFFPVPAIASTEKRRVGKKWCSTLRSR